MATASEARLGKPTAKTLCRDTLQGVQMSSNMSPAYIFRIDEIRENPHTAASYDVYGNWNPSTDRGDNERMSGTGATGTWWYCDGQSIQALNVSALPAGSSHFQTFSTFYSNGTGFWILRGDATNPPAAETWHPLSFDWDEQDYSAYLTNAGEERTVRVQRNDQRWTHMLLPTTNQIPPVATHQTYGGLKGDIAIFLALVAMSMRRQELPAMLPRMFSNGVWQIHRLTHGRLNQRGVIVYVYTVPAAWDPTQKSTAKDLKDYQEGVFGKYYH